MHPIILFLILTGVFAALALVVWLFYFRQNTWGGYTIERRWRRRV